MKYEIYQEKNQPEEEIVRLRLKHDSDGDIMLSAVDESGERIPGGNILFISNHLPHASQRIHLMHGLSSHIGFLLDKEGRAEVS